LLNCLYEKIDYNNNLFELYESNIDKTKYDKKVQDTRERNVLRFENNNKLKKVLNKKIY
jgi:hypothetical protein